jgi:nicotinic acid mononucleotide adenylyltransferase
VSSSAVRQSNDVEALKDMLSESVLDYIRQHKLYAFAETEEEGV